MEYVLVCLELFKQNQFLEKGNLLTKYLQTDKSPSTQRWILTGT